MSQEVKYEFGVMSRKWELEANSKTIAYIAMCLFVQKNIPVAVYSPDNEVFNPFEILKSHNPMDIDAEVLERVLNSIKEVQE